MCKAHNLANVTKSIPRNANYTSHDVQNKIIDMMSSIQTEEIVIEVGDSWQTIKVDGTHDPTGQENISIVVRYVNKNDKVCEQLLVMATAKKGDADILPTIVINELAKVGLSTKKNISGGQVIWQKYPSSLPILRTISTVLTEEAHHIS